MSSSKIRKTSGALILIFLTFQMNGQQESPYQINWKKDLVVLGGSAGLFSVGFALSNSVDPLSIEEISLLDRGDVVGFDRSATRRYSTTASDISDGLLLTSIVLPFTLVSGKKIRSNLGTTALLLGESFFISAGITNITKGLTKRTRPFAYNAEVPIEKKTGNSTRLSFFSGHVSSSAVLSFFTAKVYSDYYPDSKFKPLVWTVAATLPALTGLHRYLAGKHYPSDVLAGYLVGALTGYFVPHFHKKKSGGKNLHIIPGTNLKGGQSMTFLLNF